MFDEIFKRWIETNILQENDLIPLFLEWNQTFGDGKATPQHIMTLTSVLRMDYRSILEYILKMVGIKKGYNWCEVYSKEGILLMRYMNE